MFTINNSRYQVLPLYRDISEAFDIKYGRDYRTPLVYPSNNWPGFQIITKSGISYAKLRNLDTDALTTVPYATTTRDMNGDGTDETIDTALQSISLDDGRYRAEILYGGVIHYSDEIIIGCAVTARLRWLDDCLKPYADYAGTGFENVLYLEDFFYNISEHPIEKEYDENDELIRVRTKNVYSFTRIVPDYIYHALIGMVDHAIVELIDPGIGSNVYLKDIEILLETGTKANYHTITVKFRERDYDPGLIPGPFYHYDEINDVKACEDIPFIDEDLSGPGSGSGSCPGFGVTISESGGNLTYVVANEPIDGTLVAQWYLNGVGIAVGSTVALGSYGTYKLQVTKDGCVVSDTYAYLSPCALMALEVTVNLEVISANVTDAPGAVTYEVYDENSLLVASSLPYSALASGTYTVVATSDDCEISEQVIVDIAAGCSHTAIITKTGSSLIASSDDGAATFEWFLDEGTGPVSISTVGTITINKNGLYILEATVAGCITSSQLVVTDYELNVKVSNPSTVVTVYGTGAYEYPVTWITGENAVKRNGVDLVPVLTAPSVGEYRVNADTFEVASFLPLNIGEIITIESL